MMKWILLIFLFCLLNIPFSIGKNRYPTSTTSFFSITTLADNGPGSLRQAIIDANNRLGEDTINFSPVLSGTILLNSSLPIITDALTLNGPGASLLCISGNSTYRIFEVSLSSSLFSVTLNKLTLSKGNANAGGALKNSGSGIMYLNDCILSENISPRSGAGDGGALANSISAQLNINNCTFINNESYTFGGAIYNLGKLNISNSTFTGNKSFKGAGIFSILSSGKVTLSNSTISGNISAGEPRLRNICRP